VKSELLAKSPLLLLPLAALFVFLAVFLVVIVVTMKKRAPAYDPVARMPLDEPKVGRQAERAENKEIQR
jgi:hypothetical protein